MSVIYNRVALIGLGLIAGSMAHAMRRAGLAGEIVGTARSAETRAIAEEIGLCDRITETAAEAVEGADLVVLCVPVGAMAAVAAEIAPHLAAGATVTDVGSVKRDVIEQVGPHLPAGVQFIPGHPLAGTEHSGPRSGFAELFDNRYTLLTPVEGTDPAAVARLRALWEGCGARVEEMDADHHDLVLAVTSHTPHLIAYSDGGRGRMTLRRREPTARFIKYFRRRFPRFPRRSRQRPGRCGRRVLTNKDADAGNPRAFHRGVCSPATRHPAAANGDHTANAISPAPARSGAASIEAGQDTDARFRGRSKANARCRGA